MSELILMTLAVLTIFIIISLCKSRISKCFNIIFTRQQTVRDYTDTTAASFSKAMSSRLSFSWRVAKNQTPFKPALSTISEEYQNSCSEESIANSSEETGPIPVKHTEQS